MIHSSIDFHDLSDIGLIQISFDIRVSSNDNRLRSTIWECDPDVERDETTYENSSSPMIRSTHYTLTKAKRIYECW